MNTTRATITLEELGRILDESRSAPGMPNGFATGSDSTREYIARRVSETLAPASDPTARATLFGALYHSRSELEPLADRETLPGYPTLIDTRNMRTRPR